MIVNPPSTNLPNPRLVGHQFRRLTLKLGSDAILDDFVPFRRDSIVKVRKLDTCANPVYRPPIDSESSWWIRIGNYSRSLCLLAGPQADPGDPGVPGIPPGPRFFPRFRKCTF